MSAKHTTRFTATTGDGKAGITGLWCSFYTEESTQSGVLRIFNQITIFLNLNQKYFSSPQTFKMKTRQSWALWLAGGSAASLGFVLTYLSDTSHCVHIYDIKNQNRYRISLFFPSWLSGKKRQFRILHFTSSETLITKSAVSFSPLQIRLLKQNRFHLFVTWIKTWNFCSWHKGDKVVIRRTN